MVSASNFVAVLLFSTVLQAGSLKLFSKSAEAQNAKVTPVEKVMELLENLRTKVEKEGKTQAAAYDKYACFCKEQADKKLHATEESAKMIKYLSLRIDDIQATTPGYVAEVAELSKNASEYEKDIEAGQDKRDKEHASYVKAEKDLAAAIDAAKGAIKALKDSKDQLKEAKLDFSQLKALTKPVLAMLQALPNHVHGIDAAVLEQLSQDPAKYEYHSNDIIATVQDLKKKLEGEKQDLDLDELALQQSFMKKDTNLKNLHKFALKDKAKRQAQLDKMDADLHDLSNKKEVEDRDMKRDQKFLDQLSAQCEEKARLFDQRSSTREGEITAITKALEALKEKVAPKFKANKKLVDLQIGIQTNPLHRNNSKNVMAVKLMPANKTTADHTVTFQARFNGTADTNVSRGTVSLLQVRESINTDSAAALAARKVAKASTILLTASRRLKSQLLAVALTRVQSAKDHFVKVRTLIKDLVARLESDAAEEATTKSFCDKSMAEGIEKRDKAQAKIETLTAQTSKLNAEEDTLTNEAATLSTQIADLNKALNEASELRADERKNNEQTIADAEEGKAGVELALKTLKDFYSGAAGTFMEYQPEFGDRQGKTVEDLAPEDVFDSEYQGSQGSSKGIIGMLDVILSDFERTIESVKSSEKDDQEEFNGFEKESNDDISAKAKSKDEKNDRITAIADDKVETENSLKEQDNLLEEAQDTLLELKKQCVDATETYQDRVASRKKEIEALKEANAALENWQG